MTYINASDRERISRGEFKAAFFQPRDLFHRAHATWKMSNSYDIEIYEMGLARTPPKYAKQNFLARRVGEMRIFLHVHKSSNYPKITRAPRPRIFCIALPLTRRVDYILCGSLTIIMHVALRWHLVYLQRSRGNYNCNCILKPLSQDPLYQTYQRLYVTKWYILLRRIKRT